MKLIQYLFFFLLFIYVLYMSPCSCFSMELPQKNQNPVSEIWKLLLQSRMGELQAINQEVESVFKRIPDISQDFSGKINKIEQSYQQYITMAKVSRGLPIELSLVDERLKKLDSDLAMIVRPVQEVVNVLKARLKEVSLLEQDTPIKAEQLLDNTQIKKFKQLLDETEERLNFLGKKFNQILHPSELLQKNISLRQDELAMILPKLWKDYYFVPTERMYEPQAWSTVKESLSSLKESFLVRIKSEIPEDRQAWITVLLQEFSLIIPLFFIVLGARKLTKRLPEVVREQWNRITKYSLPFLFFGFTCLFSSWSPSGENYYLISIIGTVFMCLGQIDLAWNLYIFDKPKRHYSPLLRLLIPIFGGILLLTIGFSGITLSLLWIAVLMLALYVEHSYAKIDMSYPIVRNLFLVYKLILWLNIIITILGWVRLSILCYLGYAALVVCIQQAFAFIHLTNIISENISQEGVQGLISGMLLAVFLPTALIVVTSMTGLWILAYPGGAYLITHVTDLDFSIGEVSFNVVQVLLVVSIFYITRSFISVGRIFISSLPGQNIRLDKNLIGPIQMVFSYVMWGIFILYTLYILGFSLTSLAVVAGGLSVGIGFGLQNIMNNFISGLLMIFGQTLREGDVIEVGNNNLKGVVRKIDMRSTIVETFDNATIFVPNSEFISGKVTNWTRNGRSVRGEVAIGVAYGSDVGLVMNLLKGMANDHPKVLHFPEPYVLFNDFGSSTLDFLLRFWVGDIGQVSDIRSELRVTIAKVFSEKNIEIAFPQLDIHVCKDSLLGIEAYSENLGRQTPVTSKV